MVPDTSNIANRKSAEISESAQVLAKDWRTVDKFTWLNRIRHLPLKRSGKTILNALATYANSDGTQVFPSQQTVADDTGYSREQVNRIMKSLRQPGWIIPIGRVSKFNRTVVYNINIEAIMNPVISDLHSDKMSQSKMTFHHCDSDETSPSKVAFDHTNRSSNQINPSRPELPDHPHHPAPAAPDEEDGLQLEQLKGLYLSWRQQSISKGVLKVMESEGSTIEYWKARLEPGQGRKVNKPIAYLRKCLENDPPSEFVAPVPPHKQYTSGEWADCIES